MDVDYIHLLFLLGLIVIIVTLLRQFWQRVRQNAERQRQQEAMLKAAQEAERKKITQTHLPQAKKTPPKMRIPLGNSLGTPFTGAIQGQAAKWEVEIHQLGRQIIGQIDTKMAALQAITLDANRTANRLEILVEHLEQIAQRQIEGRQERADNPGTVPAESPESPPTVIPVTESVSAVTPLAEVLQELTEDIKDFRNTVQQSTSFSEFTEHVERATVLRMEEVQTENLREEVEMLANYGLEPPEIAQRLNLSVGEVNSVLQVRENRAE